MRRILVIEDDRDLALLAATALRNTDTEVAMAHDGVDGLDAVRSGPLPDLILLDIQMPGLDGWSVLEELRRHADTAAIPVFICSVRSSTADREHARRLGADGYLAKPYAIDELRSAVDELLGRAVTESGQG